MSKWHSTQKKGKEIQHPIKEGIYWVTDGTFIEIGYWHSTVGWGLSNRIKRNPIDDWNFDVKYWKEIKIPSLPKKIKERE